MSDGGLASLSADDSYARLHDQRLSMAMRVIGSFEAGASIEVIQGGPCTGRSGVAAEVAMRWNGDGVCTIVSKDCVARALIGTLYPRLSSDAEVRLLTLEEFSKGWFPARRSGDLVIVDDADEYAPQLQSLSRVLWVGSTVAATASWPAVPPDRVLRQTVCSTLVVELLNEVYPRYPVTQAPALSEDQSDAPPARVRVHESRDVAQAVYAAASFSHRSLFGRPGRVSALRLVRPGLELERPGLFQRRPTSPLHGQAVALVVDVDDEFLLSRALGTCHSDVDLFVVRGITNPIVEAARRLSTA